ncbi:MAG TPA: type VI secretion system tip protein VgrG [Polyangium sp.]|nr:type VI secretion system tip protein VgrG [Polyangium sp.]
MAQNEYEYVEMTLEASFVTDPKTCQLHEVSGLEAISKLFWFEIELVWLAEAPLDPESVIGERASLVVTRDNKEVRRINGVLSEIEHQLDTRTKFRTYKLRLVPTVHQLSLASTYRVYLDTSPVKVIEKTLLRSEVPADQFQMQVSSPLANAPRDLIVQYGETDLDFICRLAEHHGISFYFAHEGNKDIVVFTDLAANAGFHEVGNSFRLRRGGDRRDVYEFGKIVRRIPGSYEVNDYDHRKAQLVLHNKEKIAPKLLDTTWAKGRNYEYAPNYKIPAHGKELAKIRSEELQVPQITYRGASDQPGFCAGHRIKVEEGLTSATEQIAGQERVDDSFDTQLLLVEVEHHARFGVLTHGSAGATVGKNPTGSNVSDFVTDGLPGMQPNSAAASEALVQPGQVRGAKEKHYRNVFRGIPVQHTYRPARVTHKPRIDGLVTGMIVTPSQTIAVDLPHTPKPEAQINEEGYYWVRFLFEDPIDEAATQHQPCSLPVRMLQPHVGADYGIHMPLRPGMEVLLGFLEGDPDRPFIVGGTYRTETPSPVVKKNATLNRIKTQSGVLIEMRDAQIAVPGRGSSSSGS